MDRDFANAVNKELRDPIRKGANEFKASAKANFPSWAAADAVSGIRASTSFSGYSIKRTANSRFTQHGSVDRYGKIRHPLFGNRDYWFDTYVGGEGWWSDKEPEIVNDVSEEFMLAVWRVVERLRTLNFSTSKVGRSTVLG